MRINKILLLCTLLLTVVGCIKDNGNYDYLSMPEIKIVRIDGALSLSPGESVEYSGIITVPEDYKTTFEYKWLVNKEVKSTDEIFKFTASEVGTQYLLLELKDKTSGTLYSYSRQITVKPWYLNGLMILSEEAGEAKLHFVRSVRVNGNAYYQTQGETYYDHEFKDVHKEMGLNETLGGAVSITEHYAKDDENTVFGAITLITKQNGVNVVNELNGETLRREVNLNQMFNNGLPVNFNPQKMVYTCWDSFVLDGSGTIYSGRAAAKEALHTEIFSAKNPFFGETKFTDMFFCKYIEAPVTLFIEKYDDNKRRYAATLTDYYNSRYNGMRLDFKVSSRVNGQSDIAEDEMFNDITYDVMFTDYLNHYGDEYSGGLAQIVKTADNKNHFQYFKYDYANRSNVQVNKYRRLDLEAKLGAGEIVGMATFKKDTYAHFCDDKAVYWYNYESDEYGVMKNDFGSKKIVSMTSLSFFHCASTWDAPHQLIFAFNDGSVEVYDVAFNDFKKLTQMKYHSKETFGNIKQIIYKLGDSSNFFFQ